MEPKSKPLPVLTPINLPFFVAAAEGRLLLQRCGACEHLFYFPRVACPKCLSMDLLWEESLGQGSIYSFTAVFRPHHPAFDQDIPIMLVAVNLDEGPLMISSLIGASIRNVRIGDRVSIDCEILAPGIGLPRFRLAYEILEVRDDTCDSSQVANNPAIQVHHVRSTEPTSSQTTLVSQ